MRNEKVIEYTKRIDDLCRAQVVQGMAVREVSDLELVIISAYIPPAIFRQFYPCQVKMKFFII